MYSTGTNPKNRKKASGFVGHPSQSRSPDKSARNVSIYGLFTTLYNNDEFTFNCFGCKDLYQFVKRAIYSLFKHL